MPAYKAPVEDALFLLNDVFHIERFANLPGFADASPDVLEAMFGTAARFCEEVLTPLNRVGDEAGCRRGDDGRVATPPGFKDAYRRYVEGGWIGISMPPSYRRSRPAGGDHPGDQRVPDLRQHGLRHVPDPDAGRDRGPAGARLGRSRRRSTFRRWRPANGPAP